MTHAKTLREWRREQFKTQEELAASAGLSHATISHIEKGRYTPTIPTLRKLARALGIQPGQIALHASAAA